MRLPLVMRFALLAAFLGLAGCNSNNKGKLEGTKWSSQEFKSKGTLIPPGAIVMEFADDGRLTYRSKESSATGEVKDKTVTGHYALYSDDYVTFYLDEPLAGSKTHRERIVVRGDTMQLIDTDGTSIPFDRVR